MRGMKEASILVPLAIGAALSIVALPASAQANRENVSSAESATGSQQGVRHQQGRVITDADYNASRPSGQPPSAGGVNDGTSKTVLVSEAPGTPAPSSEDAQSSANPFMPEVDDEGPNPTSAPAQPAASQPQQTDYGFVRTPASPASGRTAGADKVTVRGWDAKSKKEATADDDPRHPGTERITDGEQ